MDEWDSSFKYRIVHLKCNRACLQNAEVGSWHSIAMTNSAKERQVDLLLMNLFTKQVASNQFDQTEEDQDYKTPFLQLPDGQTGAK